jgi:aspartate/methionine/tyrosine aminotransferase
MNLPPFLLGQWLEQKHSANPPVEYDLGSSTGPVWTLRELLSLGGDIEQLLDTKLFYMPSHGSPALRAALAGMVGVEPEEILLATGGAEALLILFHLAAGPGANVVLPNPGFPANDAIAQSFGLETRHYTLRAENHFQVDVEEIERLVDRATRLVLVNSPHNPTGAVLSEAQMRRLHDFCAERRVQFVSDEVYHPIYHGPAGTSASRLPRATVIGDFSKALCLSGLRIGWIVEHDPARREQFLNARNYFTASSAAPCEYLAAIAVTQHETIYERARSVAGKNLGLLDGFFDEHRDHLSWVRPAGGMTGFPKLNNGGDGRRFCRELLRRGLLLAPGDCFGMPAHFRIGFAASGETFARALEKFSDLLKDAKTLGQPA